MKRRRCALTVGACALVVMIALSASAQGQQGMRLVPDPLKDPRGYIRLRTRCADLVITGVVSKIDDRVTYKRAYYTFVTVDVDSVLRGTLDSSCLTFWYPGGVGETLVQIGSLQTAFLQNQEVLLFLFKRSFSGSVGEGQTPPAYMLGGPENHYVLVNGEVRRGGRPRIVRDGEIRRLAPKPYERSLYSSRFMLDEIGSYVTSIRPESLAVRAEAVVIGEVVGRQPSTEGAGAKTDVVEFRRDVVVKGIIQEPVIRIKVRSVSDKYDCFFDQPPLPIGRRMVVFLSGTDGEYHVPLGGWAASRTVGDPTDERALIERITAAIQ